MERKKEEKVSFDEEEEQLFINFCRGPLVGPPRRLKSNGLEKYGPVAHARAQLL